MNDYNRYMTSVVKAFYLLDNSAFFSNADEKPFQEWLRVRQNFEDLTGEMFWGQYVDVLYSLNKEGLSEKEYAKKFFNWVDTLDFNRKYRVTIVDPLCNTPDHKIIYEFIWSFNDEVNCLRYALERYFQDEYILKWEKCSSVNQIIESVGVFFPDVEVYVDEFFQYFQPTS